MRAIEYLKLSLINEDETIYNSLDEMVGTISQLMEDYAELIKKMDKPKRKNKTFTKKDMLHAFNSGRSRRWDTGVLYYNNFETWYKNNYGFKKGFKIK